MAHSDFTQGIHYQVRNREKLSKEGSKFIREHYYPKRKVWSSDETEKVKEVVRHQDIQLTPKKLKMQLPDINASPRQLYDKARRELSKLNVDDEGEVIYLYTFFNISLHSTESTRFSIISIFRNILLRKKVQIFLKIFVRSWFI